MVVTRELQHSKFPLGVVTEGPIGDDSVPLHVLVRSGDGSPVAQNKYLTKIGETDLSVTHSPTVATVSPKSKS